MFYSDYVDNHIYSATLDTGADPELLLNDNVEVPGNEDIHNYYCLVLVKKKSYIFSILLQLFTHRVTFSN